MRLNLTYYKNTENYCQSDYLLRLLMLSRRLLNVNLRMFSGVGHMTLGACVHLKIALKVFATKKEHPFRMLFLNYNSTLQNAQP